MGHRGSRLCIQPSHFRKPGRRALPRIRLFVIRATRVVLQNADGVRIFSLLQQFRHVRLNVFRRNAPRFLRQQHFPFRALRHRSPEDAVQHLPVRFRQNSRFRHFVFVLPQDISQVFDFLVHAVQHLPHRVHLHVPAFELFQGKPDGQVLRQLHQHALIQFFVLPLLGEPRERIPQRLLRLARQLRHLILKFHRGRGWIRARSNAPKRRQRPQDSIDRFVIRTSKHPAAGTCPFSDTTAKPRAPPPPASDSCSTRCTSQTPAAPARAACGSHPPPRPPPAPQPPPPPPPPPPPRSPLPQPPSPSPPPPRPGPSPRRHPSPARPPCPRPRQDPSSPTPPLPRPGPRSRPRRIQRRTR